MNFSEAESDFSRSLKNVFDHFRNYLIAASILFVGISALENPQWHGMGKIGNLTAAVVTLIAVILAVLNTAQVVMLISSNIRPLALPGRRRKKGYLVAPFLIIGYLSIVYILVIVGVNIQFSGQA